MKKDTESRHVAGDQRFHRWGDVEGILSEIMLNLVRTILNFAWKRNPMLRTSTLKWFEAHSTDSFMSSYALYPDSTISCSCASSDTISYKQIVNSNQMWLVAHK